MESALVRLYLKFVTVLILSKRFVLLLLARISYEMITDINKKNNQQIGHITSDNASNNITMVDEFAVQYHRKVGEDFNEKRAVLLVERALKNIARLTNYG